MPQAISRRTLKSTCEQMKLQASAPFPKFAYYLCQPVQVSSMHANRPASQQAVSMSARRRARMDCVYAGQHRPRTCLQIGCKPARDFASAHVACASVQTRVLACTPRLLACPPKCWFARHSINLNGSVSFTEVRRHVCTSPLFPCNGFVT